MEKRNVATTARTRDSSSADEAISSAARCIKASRDAMKKATDLADKMREMANRNRDAVAGVPSMTKKAMEEDEKADRESAPPVGR